MRVLNQLSLVIAVIGMLLGASTGFQLQAQNTCQDAINLANAFNTNNEYSFYRILAAHAQVNFEGNPNEEAKIKAVYERSNNKVLLEYIELFEANRRAALVEEDSGGGQSRPTTMNYSLEAPIPGIGGGGFGWSTVADGLSKFVVGRVKQELIASFIQRFHDDFDEKVELQVFFPTTEQYLDVIEGQNDALMVDALRGAFRNDLRRVPQNIPNLAKTDKYRRFLERHPTLQMTLATAAATAFLVDNKDRPAKIIDELVKLDYVKNTNNVDLKRSLQTLAFVSKSLKNNGLSEGEWISDEYLERLENTPDAPILFMGLNFQKHGYLVKDLVIDPDKMVVGHNDFNWSFDPYKQHINMDDVMNAYTITNTKAMPLTQADADTTRNSIYYMYQSYFHNFLKLNKDIDEHTEQLSLRKTTGAKLTFAEHKPYLDTFLELIRYAMLNKTFGAPNSRSAFNTIVPALVDIRQAVEEENYHSVIVYLNIILINSLPNENTLKDDLLRYGLFMANVSSAQSSDQVHLALEAVALPVGSSSIKRKAPFNISLNTYVGPFVGSEHLDNRVGDKWATVAGLYAPLGIAISRGHKNLGSLTLFGSIIDLGALVSFRFNDPLADQLPEFKLQNIIAPGAYLIYGIPRYPVSIGGGVQFGPELRQININNAITESSAYRWSMFIGIDIPLMNFYTQPQ